MSGNTPAAWPSRSSVPPACWTPSSWCARWKVRLKTCWVKYVLRIDRGERALVTTLTVKMAEDLTDYLEDHGVKTKYMHHEVDTFERMEIIKDLRVGAIDVIVGINLLREGLDLPEVSLIAILDADKEGFLRSETSLDPDHWPRSPQCQRRSADVR